jgi:UDP-N-acetylmuramyl pentapeptide phosphotransferase/UDP-N-acetylglucosamine-1-phosphate transferase
MEHAPILGACLGSLVGFAVCAGIVRSLVGDALRRLALDRPNERSLHTQPVPRLGGLGIICGTLAGWAVVSPATTPSFWVGALLLGIVSLVEDVRGVPMAGRLLAQFVASGYFVYTTIAGAMAWPLLLVVVIGIVWVTNLYNFMDGSDGLAGGMALFGFGAYGIGAWVAGADGFAAASTTVAAAAVAFLLFNFAPAKIFMGDIGSIPLGFLAASFGLFGWRNNLWPAWFPFLVFSPFLIDASVTIVVRQLHGEKIWCAHRSHYYQRLVLMGWGHRKVALAEYGLMFAVAISALVGSISMPAMQTAIIVGWAAVYVAILRSIDARWARFQLTAPSATPET